MNFENNKKLAGEASILLLLSIIPYVGWVLGIIGIVLLLKSMKEFSAQYQDERIYQNSWTGIKYYIVALVAATVAVTAMVIGFASAIGFGLTGSFAFTAGFGVGLIALIAGLVTAFVFYVLAATHLKTTFNILAEKSGDQTFATAGTLLWVGSILTIILVGLVLIFIAWIFAAIGFFSMKNQSTPQYTAQPYGYTPPQQPAQPFQPTQTSKA
ncbi:MAG: DUF996 domain-containing protein [Candidatus Bathyarchaeota archaeon]|nr:DUF996 domain-containing protein [Candidatus Bathyarchaeota archaeon]